MKYGVYLLSSMLCLASCTSSESLPVAHERKYRLSEYTSVELQESFVEAGVPTISTQNTYIYTDGLLRERVFHQQSKSATAPFELKEQTYVTYADRMVTIDNGREAIQYVLNDEGFALSAERMGGEQRRTYRFAYTEAGRLTCVTEMIDGVLFAQCDIVYKDNVTAEMKTTMQGHTQSFRLTFEPENIRMIPNRIPILFGVERYPLSVHETAFYANLLGAHSPTLLKEVSPLDSEDSTGKVSYTYIMTTQGEISMLTATTNSHGNQYTRSVSYTLKR